MFDQLRDMFMPHGGNDYTPHVLQRTALLLMSVMIMLTFLTANLHSMLWTMSEWLVSAVLPGVIVELTNDERADEGAVTLRRNALLDAAATQKAQHMAANEYFAHYSPDGVSPWYWFNQVSYEFAHAGENLAIHFTDSEAVVEAWMNSPSHRANIVDPKFQEIGVGTARGQYQGYDTVFVVQLFGAPAAPVVTETITVEQQTSSGDVEPVVLAESFETVSAVADEAVSVSEASEPRVDEPTLTTSMTQETVEKSKSSAANAVAFAIEEAETETTTALPVADDAPTTSVGTTSPQVVDVVVAEDQISLYSDTFATSSGRAVVPLDPTFENTESVSVMGTLATQPNNVLQLLYLVLGVFVIFSLLISIFVELQHQRPVQVAYGVAMLFLMSGLFYLHTFLTNGALVV